MTSIIVGLGNPGYEYEDTRHNIGRRIVELFAETYGFPEWKLDKKRNALISKETIEKTKVELVLPETFMNKSGKSLAHIAGSKKKIEHMIVVHDDLDLPIGTFKISFGRGTGGHKGVESITKAVKSKAFVRVRIGVAHVTGSGKIKKPQGEAAVSDFVIGRFNNREEETLNKEMKTLLDVLETIALDGRITAMNEYN